MITEKIIWDRINMYVMVETSISEQNINMKNKDKIKRFQELEKTRQGLSL